MSGTLLEIKNLKINFHTEDGTIPAIKGIDLKIDKGEILGLVGESGCGKSVTSLSVMRLIPTPPGQIVEGEIIFEGEDLLKKSDAEMRKIRGNNISMIFQEPMTSLNPVLTCGEQIAEAIKLHQGLSHKESFKKSIELLELVGVPIPEERIYEYPHQLSGGLRQRVMIAMALSCNPSLLIADEPTTALDVTIQAQILELLKRLKNELGMSILFITHDLGVVAETCERVAVMYAGNIVEEADVVSIFRNPTHPYTKGLLNSIPKLDHTKGKLSAIEGVVPNPLEMPQGCSFNTRCPYANDTCFDKEPPLTEIDSKRSVACWRYNEI